MGLAPSAEMRIGNLRNVGYRRSTGNTDRLKQSVMENGIMRPVILAPDRTVLSGERRIHVNQQLGHNTVPVLYVSSYDELIAALKEENTLSVGKVSLYKSELAYQVSLAIEAKLVPGTWLNGREQSPLQTLSEEAVYGIKDTMTLSSLVFLHRAAFFGFDEAERTEAFSILNKIDESGSVSDLARVFRGKLREKYGIRVDYTYIDQISRRNGNGNGTNRRVMSASEQRSIMERTLAMLEGANSPLSELGKFDPDISVKEIAEWMRRLAGPRVTLNNLHKTMRGKVNA